MATQNETEEQAKGVFPIEQVTETSDRPDNPRSPREGVIPPPPHSRSESNIAKFRKKGLSPQELAECANLYRLVCERLVTKRDSLSAGQLDEFCKVLSPDPYDRAAALLVGVHPTANTSALRKALEILQGIAGEEPLQQKG
jgi:hypothetical protein